MEILDTYRNIGAGECGHSGRVAPLGRRLQVYSLRLAVVRELIEPRLMSHGLYEVSADFEKKLAWSFITSSTCSMIQGARTSSAMAFSCVGG